MNIAARIFLAAAVGIVGLGGFMGGAIVQRSRCVEALALADQNMEDMTTYAKSGLAMIATGIRSALVGQSVIGDPSSDPAYQRLMVNLPKYKEAEARCK